MDMTKYWGSFGVHRVCWWALGIGPDFKDLWHSPNVSLDVLDGIQCPAMMLDSSLLLCSPSANKYCWFFLSNVKSTIIFNQFYYQQSGLGHRGLSLRHCNMSLPFCLLPPTSPTSSFLMQRRSIFYKTEVRWLWHFSYTTVMLLKLTHTQGQNPYSCL